MREELKNVKTIETVKKPAVKKGIKKAVPIIMKELKKRKSKKKIAEKKIKKVEC